MSDSPRRRNYPRSPYCCFARFRTLTSGPNELEHICITRDFSREGLYFLSLDPSVRVSTQLLLTFPYLSDSDARRRQFLVEVVRTRPLDTGRCGVAVKLISTTFDQKTERNELSASDSVFSNEGAAHRINLYG